MKLILSVPLIWMLFSSAGALDCVQDSLGSDPKPCNSSDAQCLTVAFQAFQNNELKNNATPRTCVPSSFCESGNQTLALSSGNIRLSGFFSCCSTDGCNKEDVPYPNELNLNGLECYTCDMPDQNCTRIQQCAGSQDRCMIVNVTEFGQTLRMQGCVSANLCEADAELRLKAISLPQPDQWDRAKFSVPECCNTSLCNPPPAA